ncbi:hypothetical protein LJ737_20635 [Hymenobacter sp. 15J16-1T3B]|uniref:hypothetical protein n=1 Tax=Hymenobacter sp. 15J16-1T3B TaxID=2886941 RepID=UPI001D0F56DE|nr:hypothetical protein [Hymenobacter sp. 15J16-1T3B]MCC3159660.1 hypothetical protein [Hymenobacter sp. 15J16-1T3B]
MNTFLELQGPARQLIVRHEATIRQILGFVPNAIYRIDVLSPVFTKYTLGPIPGTDQWAMLHHFTGPDPDPRAHDHPVRFESHVLAGSYRERVYENGGFADVLRPAGSSHVIEPTCIHRLLDLPEGECWTLCLAGPVVRAWRHYDEAELLP